MSVLQPNLFQRIQATMGGAGMLRGPLQFAGLELYLDSRLSLSGFANGANVTSWLDQSGHSPTRDAIHNTVDPTMGRTGGNLTPKGAPSVVFQVANDAQGLQARSTFTWPNPNANGWTVYWYGKALNKAAPPYGFVNQVVWAGDAANVHFQALVDSGGPRQFGYIDDAGGGNPHRFGTTASIAGNWHLHTIVLPSPNNNTVNGRYYLDGVLQTQVAGPATYKVSIAGAGGYALGNTTGFNVAFDGNLGWLGWFSRTHSQADIDALKLWTSIFFGF